MTQRYLDSNPESQHINIYDYAAVILTKTALYEHFAQAKQKGHMAYFKIKYDVSSMLQYMF